MNEELAKQICFKMYQSMCHNDFGIYPEKYDNEFNTMYEAIRNNPKITLQELYNL